VILLAMCYSKKGYKFGMWPRHMNKNKSQKMANDLDEKIDNICDWIKGSKRKIAFPPDASTKIHRPHMCKVTIIYYFLQLTHSSEL
jgi:hypothetical protein